MVSVLIPIYNASKFLDECLNSLSKQSLKEIEFILINDGSTDNSQEIIDKWVNSDTRFKSFIKENGGQVSAYLYGFSKSVGEYIGFVDSDDIASEDMFSKLYAKAKENNADVVICKRACFHKELNDVYEDETLLPDGLYKDHDIEKVWNLTLPRYNSKHFHNSRWNKLFKREVFEENIKYTTVEAKTFEDRFIVPSCIFGSKSIYILNEALYNYRLLDISSKSKPRDDLFHILNLLYDNQKQMLIDYNLYGQYKESYELACLDYLALYIRRNILKKSSLKSKMHFTKLFINDNYIRELIYKYKKSLTDKLGKALVFCTKCKFSLLFSILCSF